MNWTLIFLFTTLLCICVITYLATKLCRVREQLSIIKNALEDIKLLGGHSGKNGNGRGKRRIYRFIFGQSPSSERLCRIPVRVGQTGCKRANIFACKTITNLEKLINQKENPNKSYKKTHQDKNLFYKIMLLNYFSFKCARHGQ